MSHDVWCHACTNNTVYVHVSFAAGCLCIGGSMWLGVWSIWGSVLGMVLLGDQCSYTRRSFAGCGFNMGTESLLKIFWKDIPPQPYETPISVYPQLALSSFYTWLVLRTVMGLTTQATVRSHEIKLSCAMMCLFLFPNIHWTKNSVKRMPRMELDQVTNIQHNALLTLIIYNSMWHVHT